MVNTIQLGVRLEKDLVNRINSLAKAEGIDRNLWIKRALSLFVADEEDGIVDEAIEDYINLRIDEETLLKHVDFSTISQDLKDARKKKLERILKKK